MYKYDDIRAIHLEITSKCQARCPMCPRRLQGGPMMPFMKISDITIEQFKTWFDKDFIKNLYHLSLCGNLGDPLMSDHTLPVIEYLRSINTTMSINLNTNGSARNKDWWIRLAQLNVKVIFGIDGLEDTHHLYRIGTNFNQIIKNAKIFIENGGNAKWDMLVFAHNEHQIEECKKLSEELGFKDFLIKHTSRFRNGSLDVLDDLGKTRYVLYPTEKSKLMIPQILNSQAEQLPTIKCKAINDRQIYVSASGNVSPCCWLDLEWYPTTYESRIDYMNKISTFPNLNNQSLKDIIDSGHFNKISNCWTTTGLKECSRQCGSFDRLNEQFV